MDRIEIKADIGVDEGGAVTGIAWPFDGLPDLKGDIITKGAFNIMPIDTPMLIEHDKRRMVGSWHEVKETDRGLEVKGQIDLSHSSGRGIRGQIYSRQITGLSIGFHATEFVRKSAASRTITSLDLVEISFVPIPANPRARVLGVKSASDADRLIEALNRAIRAFS